MKYIIYIIFFVLLQSCVSQKVVAVRPATVIITAGQSNTDGRVDNKELPKYILQDFPVKYSHCKISKGSLRDNVNGFFNEFYPSIDNKNNPHRWAFDAVTYYHLEKALKEDFYVIKWSLGGTAIDTAASSNSRFYWQAHEKWLDRNKSTIDGGQSLLLAFEDNIEKCIDSTLSKLKQGYQIRAFLWHQGESDYGYGDNYFLNLKQVVLHVRSFLVEKTGNDEYESLPFICGTVSRSNKRYDPDVEKAMLRLASELENFYVVDMSTAELQDDKLHFTAASSEYLGIQMYNRLLKLGVVGAQ